MFKMNVNVQAKSMHVRTNYLDMIADRTPHRMCTVIVACTSEGFYLIAAYVQRTRS